ncbi:MAG TPA: right-handed parallel beta-helix repeat-containing protein [Pyrinomonadaceae bacterium]|nr:right-handed parallel beta-helix repeat-containing protein [Pyrinomonadaceae bacterium]
MYRLRFLLSIAATLFFSLALSSTTQAAARTYVSVTGSDANPCTYTSPCRLFQHAHDLVADMGEVIALTSGGYGTLNITKNVTISGVGVSAVASPNSTEPAITIATAGITVVLRSIIVRAFASGTGGSGISVTAVGNLHVEDCVISGFASIGIDVFLTADGSHIFIKDTVTRNNAGGGVYIQTSTGAVRASIDNCRSERNLNGFFVSFNSRVTIKRSVASGNGDTGFLAIGIGAGTTTELNCEECVASNNNNGFAVNTVSSGAATIRVSHSTATNNAFGFVQSGTGVFNTLGNNLVRGNTSMDTSGTITPITLQ